MIEKREKDKKNRPVQIQKPKFSMTKSIQSSDEIIKSVLLEEKIRSMFEITHETNEDRGVIRKAVSFPKMRSAESLRFEKKKSWQTFIRSKQNIERISENEEENKKDEEEETKTQNDSLMTENDEEKEEENRNYLKSGFTKDDVYNTSLDLESLDSSINKGLIEQRNFRENAFKKKMDVEMFLGRKFVEGRRNDLKMRESLCYENWEKFKEFKENKNRHNRCPCYSNCKIF